MCVLHVENRVVNEPMRVVDHISSMPQKYSRFHTALYNTCVAETRLHGLSRFVFNNPVKSECLPCWVSTLNPLGSGFIPPAWPHL